MTMALEWKKTRLAEVCNFQNGFAFKNSDYIEEGDGAFEIFRMGHILRGGGFNPDGKKALVAHEQAQKLGRFLANEGDILMCMTDMKSSIALLGHTARMPVSRRYLVNQRVGRITVKKLDLLDQHFLYYYSNSPNYIDWLRSHANSGVQVNLSTEAILNSPIPLPPLPVQQRIAGILSAYDELMENSQRRIRLLEAMARALYREWFVQFRFPGHEKVPLVASPLGSIPKGWEVRKLGGIADISWGDTATTKASYVEEGYPAYSASGLDGKLDHYDFDRTGVVLSAIGAQCGKTWLARGKWSCIKNTIRFWSKDECVTTEFLFMATEGQKFWPRRGAAQPFISQGDAERIDLLTPDCGTMRRFTAFAADALKQIATLQRQIQNLRQTRDLLLPKLLAGEIDVSHVEEPKAIAV